MQRLVDAGLLDRRDVPTEFPIDVSVADLRTERPAKLPVIPGAWMLAPGLVIAR